MQLLSVIIPVYNTAEYLEKCLDSVLNQTYTNIEVILINDGSTDNSLEICKRYQEQDVRIVLVSIENQGLANARNIGLDIAHGDLIAFVDSDDYVENNIYQKMIECFNQENVDIVICNFYYVNERNERITSGYNHQKISGRMDVKNDIFQLIYADYTRMVVAWNKVYRKSIFQDIRYPKGKVYEDNFVIHKILYAAESIYLLNTELYAYRKRKGSISQLKKVHEKENEIEAVDDRLHFFIEHGQSKELCDLAVRESLRKKILICCLAVKKGRLIKYNDLISKTVNEYKQIVNRQTVELYNMGIEFVIFPYFPRMAAIVNLIKMKLHLQ